MLSLLVWLFSGIIVLFRILLWQISSRIAITSYSSDSCWLFSGIFENLFRNRHIFFPIPAGYFLKSLKIFSGIAIHSFRFRLAILWNLWKYAFQFGLAIFRNLDSGFWILDSGFWILDCPIFWFCTLLQLSFNNLIS